MLPALPAPIMPSKPSGAGVSRVPWSWERTPMKTPVLLPPRPCGSRPARSNVSQVTSRSSRCWGSMESASRGGMPKRPASKPPASWRKPPSLTYILPTLSGSGSYSSSMSHPRSAGIAEIRSRSSTTARHRSSGESMPPGKRHAADTIAIGSWRPASSSRSRARARCRSAVTRFKYSMTRVSSTERFLSAR